MSSKRRIRRRSCTSKKLYPSKNQAKKALREYVRAMRPVDLYRIYKCRFGNHWHLGRVSEQYKKR